MNLRPAKYRGDGHVTACGPYAISCVTGIPVEDIENKINDLRGRRRGRKIGSAFASEIERAVSSFGFRTHREYFFGSAKITFARWLRERRGTALKSSYIVLVTDHFVAVKGRKMVDTYTKEPVFIRKAPHRRKRMQWVLRIEKTTRKP